MGIVKAGIIQFDVRPGQVEANVAKASAGVRELAHAGATLVLLPEMWSCGFDYDHMPDHAAKTPGVIETLGELARTCGLFIGGSLPRLAEGSVQNTLFLMDPQGKIIADYAKIHLFSPGDEHHHFKAGDRPTVCDTALGRTGCLICYDLRFPELCRTLALDGAETILVSAQWPLSRLNHWKTLLRARAIENQVFILASNSCGADSRQDYAGHSMILTPWGDCLVCAGREEVSLTASLDLSQVAKVRAAIPCFADRRPLVYTGR